jgi:acyl-CoA hydrolase
VTGRRASPTEAAGHIPAGARVVTTSGCATPATLLRELAARARAVDGITVTTGLLLGDLPFRDAVRDRRLRVRTWHVAAGMRDLQKEGLIDYMPVRARDVPNLLEGNVDVLLMRVSPPDRRGYCSFGPSASYTRAALHEAGLVIAEVDEALPRTWGDTAVHDSAIDVLVEADTDTCAYHTAPVSEASERIASLIVDLLPRHPTIQLGIGAIPESVAAALARADLGRLRMVGMGSDRVVDLFERDVLRPTDVYPDAALTAVELLGTRLLLDFAHDNPAVGVVPSTTCHDPQWLATLPRLVSVNSAIEMDLSGQVASESVSGRVISGIGGSVDFFEGAHWSEGGMRIIAMQSTTPDGSISKIVPRLAQGTPVTVPRHSVDLVVTEHGVTRLCGRTERERAEALIGLASPAHRDGLAASL